MPQSLARLAPWPLPALTAWTAGWIAALALRHAGLGDGWVLAAGMVASTVVAQFSSGLRRRAIAALGFPVSALLLAGLGDRLSPWAWLLAALPLLLLYPLRAWRDAPFFPTPAAALMGLETVVRPAPRRVLDAGCGVGHGLAALQRLWPGASLCGVEWSAPMAWLAARRLPQVQVLRGDMWVQSWTGLDLVYLFQRPESMARAWAKAEAEMGAGAWLASLEFPIPGVVPHATLDAGVGRPLFVYRVQGSARRQPSPGSTASAPGR